MLGVVKIVEPLGDRMGVYLECSGKQEFCANIDPHVPIKVEDEIQVYFDLGKIYIFELGDTGRNIGGITTERH